MACTVAIEETIVDHYNRSYCVHIAVVISVINVNRIFYAALNTDTCIMVESTQLPSLHSVN